MESPNFDCNENTQIVFNDVKIGKPLQKFIFIKNVTPILTKMSLKSRTLSYNTDYQKSRSVLYFGNESGTFITIEPSEIVLQSYETTMICLNLHSSMWGSYFDNLDIELSEINSTSSIMHSIPVHIDINDCPVRIYSGTVFEENEEIAMLRYLTFIFNIQFYLSFFFQFQIRLSDTNKRAAKS